MKAISFEHMSLLSMLTNTWNSSISNLFHTCALFYELPYNTCIMVSTNPFLRCIYYPSFVIIYTPLQYPHDWSLWFLKLCTDKQRQTVHRSEAIDILEQDRQKRMTIRQIRRLKDGQVENREKVFNITQKMHWQAAVPWFF